MPVLVNYAPIDDSELGIYRFDGPIPQDLVEGFGLYDDNRYQFMEGVWDVDAQSYVIVRDTLEEAIEAAVERFRQELEGRYEDAVQWDDDVKGLTWEEYWHSFAECLPVLYHSR